MRSKMIYLISFVLVLGLVGVSAAQEIDPNLVCWLTFDEGTDIYAEDASGNNNYGELMNGPIWTTGRIGGGLDLDGSNDYVDCGNAPSLNITEQITLALWINPRNAGNNQHQHFLGKGDNSYVIKQNSWNNLEIVIYIGGWKVATLPMDSSYNGIWHHCAASYDGSQIKLYVNGELRATTKQTGAINTNAVTVRVGSEVNRRYYGGLVDDARIYNRALSDIEVKKLANPERASSPVPADNGVISQTEVVLQWDAGVNAALHDVYFGETFADVNSATTSTSVIYKGSQSQNSYPADGTMAVELGKTYYWRVDEVDSAGNINRGDVWSFTIQPLIAYNPSPANEAKYVDLDADLAWSPGFKAQSHDVYFGTSRTDVENATTSSSEFKGNQTALTYELPALENDMLYYWRIDEQNNDATVSKGDIWRFRTLPSTPITDPNLVGWWKLDDDEGRIAFDWSGQGNNGNLIGEPQWIMGYDDGALYFDGFDDAIDCGNPDSLNATSAVTLLAWVKTETAGNDEDQSYVTKGNDCYGLRHSLANNLEFRISDTVSVLSPVDGSFNGVWHHLAGTYDGSQLRLYVDGELRASTASAGTIPTSVYNVNIARESVGNRFLYNGVIDDVRIYNKSLTEEQIKDIIRGDPTLAQKPSPANGSTLDIEQFQSLSWTPGEKAAQHDVYLGTDALDVEYADTADTEGIYRGRQDANSYTPADGVIPGQTYYWRVDEINTDATVSKGKIWAFIVLPYLIVDDFEDYNDYEPNRIFDAWADCFTNNTGMTVGHFDTPFAEHSIVHSGRAAMYMRYDNDGTVNEGTPYEQSGTLFYSEAQRSLDSPQDWTRKGVDTLSLWFRGIPASVGSFTLGPPITMTAAGEDIWGTADQFHFAYRRLSGLGSITARVVSVTDTDPWAKAGVMIRETLEPGSANAVMVVTPVNGVSFQYRTTVDSDSISTTEAGITAPQWVRVTRSGNTLTGEYSADGSNWVTLDTVAVPMLQDVYMGLCLTSHNVEETCTAEFSDVSTTGTVTGDWQSQDIGIQSNAAEPMYLVLEDSAGNSVVINHPDPAAATVDAWTQWSISLTEFAGLNLQAVNKISIGVGDRANPQAGGSGTLYIDDIGLLLPSSAN
jgi:regulation of enolase protein 1 (concanavalin A-like superfamily)